MEDSSGNNPVNANTANTPPEDADRDFDREPDEAAAPASPEEIAAAEAAEAAAQANARRARARLLSERATRETMSPQPAVPEVEALAPEAEAPFAPKRGKQRWPVKTINDQDRDKIKFATEDTSFPNEDIQETTVEDLWLQERPADMPLTSAVPKYQSNRATGPETTIWQVEGRIISHKWEKDGDFHLVLQDLGSGYTMVVESPQTGDGSDDLPFVDVNCPEQVKTRIERARGRFEEELDPKPFFQNSSRKVTIRGVGFFDILHGATGAAETNSIELHPVIDVEFKD
jgi:hypothetical protein